jgi:hypothetical protein
MQNRNKSPKYVPIVQKSIIKRVRKSENIDTACKQFMENAFIPSR